MKKMRDYILMRKVMALAVKHGADDGVKAFFDLGDAGDVESELARLSSDGLLQAEIESDCFDNLVRCRVGGLTQEGREFYKLVENPDVWRIVHGTLEAAKVDVSYPLLKEVCEEIVRRYVTSFIPERVSGR